VTGGPTLHFFYQENDDTKAWEGLPELAVKAFEFIQDNYGEYPWSDYSIIQGGDGGMEYPMATLITGNRSIRSLIGVTVHEALHTWYQGLLAFNESYYSWMDEGFTTYASAETMAFLYDSKGFIQNGSYRSYFRLANSGREEALSTHADHFVTNYAYGSAAYRKGAVALAQMNYILGEETTARALKRFYYDWRFKHPDANDWIRVFEKESGLELDWYLDYWVNSTHTIDYGIDSVLADGSNTRVVLRRIGKMPMPCEILISFKDGTKKLYYAPLVIMRGEKNNESSFERVVLPDWPWTHPSYAFTIEESIDSIVSIEIDYTQYMADIERSNNTWENN
jgi:aminopeptidase N